ncbi:MAG: hypothetical protein A2Y75_05455 [Candidatus Solincola sediminis]|uniref:Terminase n=1 Tax=Candidatus Solincola sediminis TaxID=1797199 RepID=A0A1F2WG57_9ACTN|nr:MAG: hypothetical protein A2Y75_05455 [Candidatus Solincola sediminis]
MVRRTVHAGVVHRSGYGYAADIIDPPGRHWRHDPVAWARERAGLELWSKQEDIIKSVHDNPKTAVHSCHEIGKSFIAAVTVAWWIDTHPPGEAFVLTTAPTAIQVSAILWREINKLHSKVGLPGRTNLTEWYLGNELVAYGRKPDENNPTGMQGTHARFFLAVLDEACGIDRSLWDAASTLAANKNGRFLAIGNPDDATGEFADVCLRDPSWSVIGVGYRDTPNFTDEPVSESLKEMLIHPNWVDDRRFKWGAQSAIFLSKCEGVFPVGASPFTVVPLHFAERCRNLQFIPGDPHQAGIDVGAGGDRTIIRERLGRVAGREEVFVDADPMRTVGRLVEKIVEWGITKVKIDPIGIGWGIMGRLKELSSKHNPSSNETVHDCEIIGVNFGEGPTPGLERRFLNKRAEVWWEVGRENSRLGTWDLGNVDDDTLQELTTPKYVIMDSYGKLKVEKKDETRKELGRSPDGADALLLAFYDPITEVTLPATDMSRIDLTRGIGMTGAYGLGDSGGTMNQMLRNLI